MNLPPEILNQHVAVLGKTGSGKTYAAKGLVEYLLDEGRQVCIIDPTGAWWGLRLDVAGRHTAHPVVLLGGERGDIPLGPASGAAVARLVTEQRPAGVVLDTSSMTVADYTRWFTDFAAALYTTIRQPLHLVIDEAHYFMPQGKVPDPAAGRMLHAGNRLMSGGRSRGIRAMLITQRPAKLHKDSLTCADTLIAMRVIAPQDRHAIKEWIDGCGDPKDGKAVLDSLASLKRGEGWVWYPEGEYLKRIVFPKIATYDSSATPKAGSAPPPAPESIDLTEIEKALSDAVADAKANDPRELKATIANLQHDLVAAKQRAAVGQYTEAHIAQARKETRDQVDQHWRGLMQDLLQKIRNSVHHTFDRNAEMHTCISNAIAATDQAITSLGLTTPLAPPPPRPPQTFYLEDQLETPPPPPVMTSLNRIRNAGEGKPVDHLPKGEKAVLTAVAQHGGCTREQLTVNTGYKRSSRDAYIQRLREKGFVDTAGNDIIATPAGIAALGSDYKPLPTGAALRQHWLDKLTGGERVILEVLIRHYPHLVTRTDLSAATEYQRSSRDAYIQRLKSRKLVETSSKGVKAAKLLFD